MQLLAPALVDESVDALIARSSFFSRFSDEQRARIIAIAKPVFLPLGKQVYTVGEPARFFYVLLEGTILFSLAVGNRQASAGQIIGNGEVFGWGALVESGQKRIASATATSPCTALAIDGAQLMALADADHSIGYALMRALNKIITGTLTAFAAG
ncbi:MAG: cyclic nucleotide-binding domain-containing protein [Usitatibacteraceae bacterium]